MWLYKYVYCGDEDNVYTLYLYVFVKFVAVSIAILIIIGHLHVVKSIRQKRNVANFFDVKNKIRNKVI